jgi:hypothetical protein
MLWPWSIPSMVRRHTMQLSCAADKASGRPAAFLTYKPRNPPPPPLLLNTSTCRHMPWRRSIITIIDQSWLQQRRCTTRHNTQACTQQARGLRCSGRDGIQTRL